MVRSGYGKRRILYRAVLIALLAVSFLMPAPAPVLANTKLIAGWTAVGAFLAPFVVFGIYDNLPSRQGKERWLNGEWYVAGYMGPAFTPGLTLNFSNGPSLHNPVQTSVVGGAKFGYFFNRIPYLGLEVETNVSRSNVQGASLSVSPPIRGFNRVNVPRDNWLDWTIAWHVVGRYGFLKDAEVPFGRLQPYLGVGPIAVRHYTDYGRDGDYGIDVMAGVRYMLLKQVSMFVEYKYAHVWDQSLPYSCSLPNGQQNSVRADFDYNSHKVVMGMALHF